MSDCHPAPEKIEAWLQGKLDPEECAALEAWFDSQPEEAGVAELPASTAADLKDTTRSELGELIERIKSDPDPPAAATRDWQAMLSPPQGEDTVGMLGEFEVLGLIEMGGMGIVLEGRDPKLARRIAIKVLAPELAAVPAARERFLREARAVAALEHDHILPIFGVSSDSELPFFTMRLALGGTLEDALHRGEEFGIERLKSIARQVASGLDAAHSAGIIHRDVKPANILFDEDGERLWVGDFGVARVTEDPGVTYGSPLAGTPRYMSPEQAEGLELDGRSDLFSLGSVLIRCALGRPAFGGESTVATLKRIAHEEPDEGLGNEYPNWFRNLIGSLHAKDPEARPASAAEVVQAIDDEFAPPPKRAERRRKWLFRSAAALTALLLSAAILLQIPTVASAVNKFIAATTRRDIILSGRVGAFESLSEAIDKARAGEKLVFTSEGPFPAPALEIPPGKPLTFEAAEGVLPRIEVGTEGEPGIITHSDLTLKRLSLANPFSRPADPAILRVVGQCNLSAEQCYFSVLYNTIDRWSELGPIVVEAVGPASLRMRSCIVNAIDCRAIVFSGNRTTANLPGGASVSIEDSCIRCSQVFIFGKGSPEQVTIGFEQSLSLGRVFLWTSHGLGMPAELQVRAKNSIFNPQRVLTWFGGEEAEDIQSALSWKGNNNLHRAKREFLINGRDPLRPVSSLIIKDLEQWRAFLGEDLPGTEERRFEQAFIDHLVPGRARQQTADYLQQFGSYNVRGPDPAKLGPR